MEHKEDIIISDLEVMMHARNYRQWIVNKVKPFIGNRILEIGSGIGNNIEYLLDRELVVGIDSHSECEKYLCRRFKKSNIFAFTMDIANTKDITRLSEFKFDTILCFNVLEHIEDELIGLQNMKEILVSNGSIILIVPAFNFLYGGIDKAVGHKRRYTKKSLLKITNLLDMKIQTLNFMNFFGIFGWFFNNKILNRKAESLPQIKF